MSCLIPPPLLLSLLWKNCWYSLFILIPQLAILTELSKTSSSQTSMRRGTSILQNENFNLRLAPPRSEIFSWNSTKSISQCSTTVITMVTKRTCLSISCQPSCSTESSHRHEPQTYQIFWIIPLESNLLSCRKKYVDISLFFFSPPPIYNVLLNDQQRVLPLDRLVFWTIKYRSWCHALSAHLSEKTADGVSGIQFLCQEI